MRQILAFALLAVAIVGLLAERAHAGLFLRRAGCTGTAAACSGSPTQACRGAAVTGCHGAAVVAVPRKVVVRTRTDSCGNQVAVVRQRGSVLIAVPVQAAPVPEKIAEPYKK